MFTCYRVQVWPTRGLKKFETLSYLPTLTPEQLAREVDYLLRKGWIPCLEFELEVLFQLPFSFNLFLFIFLAYGFLIR